MVRFSPMAVVACMLCVGILYLGFESPRKAQVEADTGSNVTASAEVTPEVTPEIATAEELPVPVPTDEPVKSEDTTVLVSQVGQAAPAARTEDGFVKPLPVTDHCDCKCEPKLADMQKEIDTLKAKVAALECTPRVTSNSGTVTSSPVVSSAPVVISSSPVVASSTCSNGTCGVVSSYPVQPYSYSSPVYSAPVQSYSAPVYSSPVYSSSTYSGYSSPVMSSGTCVGGNCSTGTCSGGNCSPSRGVLFPNARWNR